MKPLNIDELVNNMGYKYLAYTNNTHTFIANDKEVKLLLPLSILDRVGEEYVKEMIKDAVKDVV